MLIEPRLPESYRCVDFNVFEAMLKIVSNVYKSKIDNITDLCSGQNCPDAFLPLLASKIGFSYIYETTPAVNREIISNFMEMLRNKGNRIGIRIAVSLGLLISSGVVTSKGVWDTIYSVSIDISYTSGNVTYNITYPEIADPIIDTSTAINMMLIYVLPAGIGNVTLTPAIVQTLSSTIMADMTDSEYNAAQYTSVDDFNAARSIITDSATANTVGFTEVAKDDSANG